MGENVLVPSLAILIPIVAIVSPFVFVIFVVWFDSRRKERQAFYRAETLRRITESSGEGAKAAIDLMREDDKLKRIKTREGMKIGGLVCVAVGVALTSLLWSQHNHDFLVGLIPGLVGVALLVYVFLLATPVQDERKG